MGKGKLLSIIFFVLAIVSFVMFFVIRNNTEYVIVFETSGGTFINSQKVKYHKKVEKPADPVRDNSTFAGWQKDGKEYDFNQPVEESMQITALWKDNEQIFLVTITLEGVDYQANVANNAQLVLSDFAMPSKEGYNIVLKLDENVFDLQTPVTSELHLNATYEKAS